ncbi:DUF3102 domain-containing protein [Bacillus altitudinis]|uniref:DUF3102 domain-containing protein n=1 Tax=Bacillus altitudinis TaxID=293387 RepID=UPI0040464DC5
MFKTKVFSNDLNIITAEINSYKQVAGQAIFEIGRRLKHVKENDLVHGEWIKWLENMDMDRHDASNVGTYPHLSQSKIFQLIFLPSNINKKEFINSSHQIPSTGETKTVDEMTVRELREVKKALKEAEQDKKKEKVTFLFLFLRMLPFCYLFVFNYTKATLGYLKNGSVSMLIMYGA